MSRGFVLGLWLVAFAVSAWSQDGIPEPTSYRMQDYRIPLARPICRRARFGTKNRT